MAILLFGVVAASPLTRQSCPFCQVAGATGDNDVFRAIRTAAGQGNYMICVITVTKIASTVIAFAFLGFVLATYISGGMVAVGSALDGAATEYSSAGFFRVRSVKFPLRLFDLVRVCCSPCPRYFPSSFSIVGAGLTRCFCCLARVGLRVLTAIFCTRLTIGCIVFLARLARAIWMLGSIPASAFPFARPTCARQATWTLAILAKILDRGRKFIFALGTMLEGHIQRCVIMEGHLKLSFQVSNPGTLARRCPVFFVGFHQGILAQMGCFG